MDADARVGREDVCSDDREAGGPSYGIEPPKSGVGSHRRLPCQVLRGGRSLWGGTQDLPHPSSDDGARYARSGPT